MKDMKEEIKKQLDLFLLHELLCEKHGELPTIMAVTVEVDTITTHNAGTIINKHINIDFEDGKFLEINENDDNFQIILCFFGLQNWMIEEKMIVYIAE